MGQKMVLKTSMNFLSKAAFTHKTNSRFFFFRFQPTTYVSPEKLIIRVSFDQETALHNTY